MLRVNCDNKYIYGKKGIFEGEGEGLSGSLPKTGLMIFRSEKKRLPLYSVDKKYRASLLDFLFFVFAKREKDFRHQREEFGLIHRLKIVTFEDRSGSAW